MIKRRKQNIDEAAFSLEEAYTKQLLSYLSCSSQSIIDELRITVINYYRDMLNAISDSDSSKQVLSAACTKISKTLNATYSGDINEFTSTKYALIVSNHIGLGKAVKVRNSECFYGAELNSQVDQPTIGELDNYEPNIIRRAAIIKFLLRNAHVDINTICSFGVKYQFPFDRIYENSFGHSLLPSGNFGFINRIMEDRRFKYFTAFPEGRTTGKYTGKSMFDLDRFHNGIIEIAKMNSIPIFSFTQHFTPKLQLFISIQSHSDSESAQEIRNRMQHNLDAMKLQT